MKTNEEDRILKRTLHEALNAAEASAQLYLENAKMAEDDLQEQALEASAIQRAVIAEQLHQVAEDRFGERRFNSRTESEAPQNPMHADMQLSHWCERLRRRCKDQNLKKFLREIRSTLSGMCQLPITYPASPARASISM